MTSTQAPPTYFVVRDNCPACDGADSQLLLELPYDEVPIFEYLRGYYENKGRFEATYLRDARYRIAECTSCGLIYQVQVPNNELLGRVYGAWIDPIAAHERNARATGSNVKQYIEELWLLDYWSKGRKLKVLDYGMGWGRWCQVAQSFGHHVSGYEFEAERQEQGAAGIQAVRYADIPAGQYDFINTEQVFEHLTEPLSTLQHLLLGLKPGGMIRLSVPNGRRVKEILAQGPPYSFTKRDRRGLSPIIPLQHLNSWTGAALQKFAQQQGLVRHRFGMKELIASKQDWRSAKRIARNLLHPFYVRGRYDDGTSLYFMKRAAPQ